MHTFILVFGVILGVMLIIVLAGWLVLWTLEQIIASLFLGNEEEEERKK